VAWKRCARAAAAGQGARTRTGEVYTLPEEVLKASDASRALFLMLHAACVHESTHEKSALCRSIKQSRGMHGSFARASQKCIRACGLGICVIVQRDAMHSHARFSSSLHSVRVPPAGPRVSVRWETDAGRSMSTRLTFPTARSWCSVALACRCPWRRLTLTFTLTRLTLTRDIKVS
jgi:hypothetical protein